MSYLLDTNVVSELRKPARRAAHRVRTWVESHNADEFYLSVITILEIETGIARLGRRDPDQAQLLRNWLENRVLDAFTNRIIPVDLTVARQAARLHVPDPRPGRDALIAATALAYGLTIVTRNVRNFQPLKATVINPWDETASGD
ncbi:type II toxin-antitoxin system VapC family toxin [Actinobaculum sp. 352]|uniref:type II toxin-antitoxin system VapC family toxin n=1 Tax=Actinobaculum sp. 352 TaxID=2490946 RepID=UPI000F7D809C|nr:type II toxin-antitoxin system VapC family toxin [Actinobaculum sp. 352]RTE50216.1 type II toxin-antitoxin system VapC family toxin [Actinobaculum sp. 352]